MSVQQALTDEMIAGAVIPAGQKLAKLTDGHSLYLLLTDDGRRRWRLRLKGSDKALGEYPAVSIAGARAKAAQLRAEAKAPPPMLAAPAPSQTLSQAVAQAVGAVPTFGQVATDWAEFDRQITAQALNRKRDYAGKKFAPLHGLPVNGVSTAQCRAVHDAVRAGSGDSSGLRAGRYMSAVFKHAAQQGLCPDCPNPAAGYTSWMGRSDRKALGERRQKHLTDPRRFGLLMERVDLWESPFGATSSNFAKLIARVPLRASEWAGARWAEFRDLDKPDSALWTIPWERMKQRKQHEMPLPRQAVAILLEQREYVRSHYPAGSEYVFPSRDTGTKHIDGDNQKRTLNALGHGKEQSIHGFRHSAMTLAVEAGRSEELWDLILAHSRKGTKARYNLAVQLEQRRAELQWWSAEIERMKRDYAGGRLKPEPLDGMDG